MPKVTVNYPQPITVRVNTGKDQIVHTSTTFVGAANSLPDTGGTINGNLTIIGDTFTGNILPRADRTYDIGSPVLRYRTLYLAGNTIDLGGGTISANGDTMVLTSPQGGTLFFTANANTSIDAAAGERAEETANTSLTLATGAYYYAGEAIVSSTYAANTANISYDLASNSYILAEGAYYYSADAYVTADEAANTANEASETANTSLALATGAYYYAAEAYIQANNAYVQANNAYLEANSAIISANLAYELANSLSLSSNAYIKRTGDTANGTIIFSASNLTNYDLNTAVGFVSSNTGIDLFAANNKYTQLNYSNTSTLKANANGAFVKTQYSSVVMDDNTRVISLVTENVFSVVVNNFPAIEVYANNDIFLNGTIYGAPTALDGGEF